MTSVLLQQGEGNESNTGFREQPIVHYKKWICFHQQERYQERYICIADGHKDYFLEALHNEGLETRASGAVKGEKAVGAADLQSWLGFQLDNKRATDCNRCLPQCRVFHAISTKLSEYQGWAKNEGLEKVPEGQIEQHQRELQFPLYYMQSLWTLTSLPTPLCMER